MARTAIAMPRPWPAATLLRAAGGGADAVLGRDRIAGAARIAAQGRPGRVGEAAVVGDQGVDRAAAGEEEPSRAVHHGAAEGDRLRGIEDPGDEPVLEGIE